MDEPGPSTAYYRRFAGTSSGPIRPPSPPPDPLLPPSSLPHPDGPASSSQPSDQSSSSSEGLYAILNVPRDAADAEIRDRYRSLAAVYHPDKQRDEASRLAAHSRFTEIQRAHEVLTDPARRAVYDLFGEEGLRTSWEVGPRNMTPRQLRTHFEKQYYVKKQLDAEALVKSKGDMSVVLDARAVFLPRSFFRRPESVSHTPLARIQRVRPGQILMRHSFETPIDDKTQFIFEGTMAARSGAGGANVAGTLRHQFSPRLWAQCTQTLLSPQVNTVKGTFTFDENTYITGTAITQTLIAPPRMSITLGRRIYPLTTSYITFKSGFFALGPWGASMPPEMARSDCSALSFGVTTARPNGSGWTVETTTGIVENGLSADWTTRFAGLTIKLGTSLDLSGISAFADATARVTEHVRAGLMLQVPLRGGVQLRVKFSRLGQKITVPLLLSNEFNAYVVVAAAVIPTASYAALRHFYLLPRKRRRVVERIRELREEHAGWIEQKRAEATDAIALMERSVTTKVAAERESHGLVIVSAYYGRAEAFTARGMRDDTTVNGTGDGTVASPTVIDVTIPVQALVQSSKLFIPGGRTKFNLLGFYDPCVGESKKLRIRYLFRDRLHECTVDDVSVVRCPVKAHALDEYHG